jgi:predicted nucleic acid-binding protein
MAFVLDSSVALAWLLPDESDPAIDALADRLETEAAVAPAIWQLEVRNALLAAHGRGRLSEKDRARVLAIVADFPIEIEPQLSGDTLASIVDLARRFALTTYDAAYLELAHRGGFALATLDARLIESCTKLGVQRLP